MNRQQLKKSEVQLLRLRPTALARDGRPIDDDWALTLNDSDDTATLTNQRTRASVLVGFDHIHSYTTDPARGNQYGFLQMLSQIQETHSGTLAAEPIPPRAPAPAPPRFNPLVIQHDGNVWQVSWRERDPALHLLAEDQPKQLLHCYTAVCDALRRESGREPQFDRPDDIQHDIVWGLSPDHGVKYRLLGGMDGKAAQEVLVLTNAAARQRG